ncbi:AAA family ATPase [Brevibacterium otitidis]|uniref:Nuclease SbcCD subunit C n=1 Tax=Brevibacterium otitidis TaxID=53364 RepID=A0ABV5WYA1_9MICO|nr:SMC family ATPase [Brevibacterium otitidis]
MRIHTLRLQAFGPFPAEETVDFDELGADGLFLISGPTGAGKTTILDALAFGLYGKVPGARNEAADYRSEYAQPETSTFVEVGFTAQQRRWRVHRSPRYTRPKKRGMGTTESRPAAQLSVWNPSSGEWDGIGRTIAEVQSEIDRVLGLRAEQFMQIVMLPQGEFARFLRADPIEREPILRRLFNTEHFTSLEAILEKRAQVARQALETVSQQRRIMMEQARKGCAEDLDLPAAAHPDRSDVAAVLGSAVAVARERVEVFATALQDARECADAAQTAARDAAVRLQNRTLLQQLRSRQDAFAAGADERAQLTAQRDRGVQAGKVRPAEQEAARAAQNEATAKDQLDTAAERLTAELTALPRRPDGDAEESGAEELVRLTADAHQAADRVSQNLQRLHDLQVHRDALSAEQKDTAQRRDELQAQAATLDAEITRLDAELAKRASVESQHHQLTQEITTATLRQQRLSEIITAEHTVDERQAQLEQAQSKAEEARSRYAEVRASRLAGIAAELAAELQDGQPCAVCGATAHPNPAAPDDAAATKADEEDALQRWTAAQEAANAARSSLAEAKAQRAALVSGLAEPADGERSDAPGTPELDGEDVDYAVAQENAAIALATLSEQRDAVMQRFNALDAAEEQRAQLNEQRSTHREKQEQTAAALQDLSQQLAGVGGKLAQLNDVVAADQTAALQPFGLTVPSTAQKAAAMVEQLQTLHTCAEAILAARSRYAQAQKEGTTRADAFVRARTSAGFASVEDYQEALQVDLRAVEAALRAAADEQARIAELTNQDWYAPACADTADATELETLTGTAEEALRTAQQQRDAIHEQLAVHTRAEQDLRELREDFVAAADEEEAALARHRGDVALDGIIRATSPDNVQRLPLSAYALLSLFIEVAHNASERLKTMSSGRFTLAHNLQRHRKETRAGLSLSVIDTFTDESRDPRALSGGETFMASLALALGLADTVSAAAGGIRLDSLFIDEGFGSLDPDALAQVLQVLDELRSGGRCVGVISHVQSMLQSIPQQLRIERSPTGSTIARQSTPAD